MVTLRRKLNYRNIILDKNTKDGRIYVRLNSGDLREVIWCGFVERKEVISRQNVRPVKTQVHSFRIGLGQWTALRENEFLQGCLVVGEGVYTRLDGGESRIVRVPVEIILKPG